MRNALVPQVTGLAMSLGAIFNGAIITEQVFGYPGVGTLLVSAVHAGDYSLVLGITTVSIVAVSLAVLLIDLLYPLLDPRVKVALSMGRTLSAISCASTASSPSASSCWSLVAVFALPVVLLALSAQRQLRRAARPAAVVGLPRWARRRAARTCSGC